MEKIILGLLMIKSMTGYEIRNNIKNFFSLMCSDSAGSFQSALKKLLSTGMIKCDELVQKGVNKKYYKITVEGKSAFFDWVEQPMNHSKAKNMELSKLFFMGMVETNKRLSLLTIYVDELSIEQNNLIKLKESIQISAEKVLQHFADNKQIIDNYNYQIATLDYGIATLGFEIQWYSTLIKTQMEGK